MQVPLGGSRHASPEPDCAFPARPGDQTGKSQTSTRYVIYLHGRIVETAAGSPPDRRHLRDLRVRRHPSTARVALGVVRARSNTTPPRTDSDSFANHVAKQVDSLIQSGGSPECDHGDGLLQGRMDRNPRLGTFAHLRSRSSSWRPWSLALTGRISMSADVSCRCMRPATLWASPALHSLHVGALVLKLVRLR